MDIFLVILLFAVGIVLIVKGGDYFVDAASWMAEVSGIPKLIAACFRLCRGAGQGRYVDRECRRQCYGEYRLDHGHCIDLYAYRD